MASFIEHRLRELARVSLGKANSVEEEERADLGMG
jgi:hypothetical protein